MLKLSGNGNECEPLITGRHAMDEFLVGSISSIAEVAAEQEEANGEPSIKTQQLLTFSSYVHQEVGLH